MNAVAPGIPDRAVADASHAAFVAAWATGRGAVVHRERVADLETPVAAFLKIADGKPNTFLLESVEGGQSRGRYSIIGMSPDLVWRCRDGHAEINRHALSAPHAFAPEAAAPLDSLRSLVATSQIAFPPDLRPQSPASTATSATTWSGRSSACPRRMPTSWACPKPSSSARRSSPSSTTSATP